MKDFALCITKIFSEEVIFSLYISTDLSVAYCCSTRHLDPENLWCYVNEVCICSIDCFIVNIP